jgi:hypothetical protein
VLFSVAEVLLVVDGLGSDNAAASSSCDGGSEARRSACTEAAQHVELEV